MRPSSCTNDVPKPRLSQPFISARDAEVRLQGWLLSVPVVRCLHKINSSVLSRVWFPFVLLLVCFDKECGFLPSPAIWPRRERCQTKSTPSHTHLLAASSPSQTPEAVFTRLTLGGQDLPHHVVTRRALAAFLSDRVRFVSSTYRGVSARSSLTESPGWVAVCSCVTSVDPAESCTSRFCAHVFVSVNVGLALQCPVPPLKAVAPTACGWSVLTALPAWACPPVPLPAPPHLLPGSLRH